MRACQSRTRSSICSTRVGGAKRQRSPEYDRQAHQGRLHEAPERAPGTRLLDGARSPSFSWRDLSTRQVRLSFSGVVVSAARRASVGKSKSDLGSRCYHPAMAASAETPPIPPSPSTPAGPAMPAPRNVILVGFMGAGKSTVGRMLARRLGRCFVETDAMITAREGRSIPEIFADRGRALLPAARGGGAGSADRQARPRGRDGRRLSLRARRHGTAPALGTVVWLAADFEAVYARANRVGGRPMLAGRSADDAAALYRDPPGVLPPRPPGPRHHAHDRRRRGQPDRPPPPRAGAERPRRRPRRRRAAHRTACPPVSASAGRRMPSSPVSAPQGHG